MLQYLKESTFRANEAFVKAIKLLKGHYISIAGLCFLLFVTNNLSSFLALYLNGVVSWVKILLLLVFLVLFFSLQLILIRRALNLVCHKEHVGVLSYIPSAKQFLSFIMGLLAAILLSVLVACVMYVLCFPLLYLGISIETVTYEIHPVVTGVVTILIILRTMFFPFFILDKDFNVFKSYRFSIALTKGNFFRLFLVLLIVSATFLFQLGAEYLGYNIVAKICSIINSFIIIPSVSLVLAVVYTDMMNDYKGEDDPQLLKNII